MTKLFAVTGSSNESPPCEKKKRVGKREVGDRAVFACVFVEKNNAVDRSVKKGVNGQS